MPRLPVRRGTGGGVPSTSRALGRAGPHLVGALFAAGRAILADCGAPALYLKMPPRTTVPLAGHGIPDRPFLVLGQYSMVDRSRAPGGAETAWAYTHVPQQPRWDAAGELRGEWTGNDAPRFADRMEAEVERLAPGFRDLIVERHLRWI